MSDSKPTPGTPEWLVEHGIDADVWKEQGATRYAAGDRAPIDREFAGLASNQITWALNVVDKSDGVLMPKHPVLGLGLPPIAPQLRPDDPPDEPQPAHYHPVELLEGDPPKLEGKPVKRCATAWEMRFHILSGKGHHPEALRVAARHGYATKEAILDLLRDRDRFDVVRSILEEAACEHDATINLPHRTIENPKYKITIAPRIVLAHDHEQERLNRPRWLGKHLRNHHPDGDVDVDHAHDGIDCSLCMVEDPDPWKSPGKRWNMNPLARIDGDVEIVFLCIEGTIKNCALLSAVRRMSLRATVLDVPSVGQWDTPELEQVIRHFASVRPRWYVICIDADGDVNPQVMNQARLLQARLTRYGVGEGMARIAAPPADLDEHGELLYKGFDDYLGLLHIDGAPHQGELLRVPIVSEYLPKLALDAWEREHMSSAKRKDRLERDRRVFEGLIRLAGPQGVIETSLQSVARFINDGDEQMQSGQREPISEDAVERATKGLIDDGWIWTDKPLSVRKGRHLGRGKWVSGASWDSDENPRIVIAHEGLRAVTALPPQLLGEWVGWTQEERDRYRQLYAQHRRTQSAEWETSSAKAA